MPPTPLQPHRAHCLRPHQCLNARWQAAKAAYSAWAMVQQLAGQNSSRARVAIAATGMQLPAYAQRLPGRGGRSAQGGERDEETNAGEVLPLACARDTIDEECRAASGDDPAKGGDHLRVEMLPGATLQFVQGPGERPTIRVRTVGEDRVERVGDGEYAPPRLIDSPASPWG